MKKLLFALLLPAVTSTVAVAAPVDLKTARETAAKSLTSGNSRAAKASSTDSIRLQLAAVRMPAKAADGKAGNALYYVFNNGHDNGITVVAGDDRLRPILARTDRGDFDEAALHPGIRWWMEAMAQTAEAVASGRGANTAYTTVRDGLPESIDPLIETRWGQSYPYNALCPQDPVHGGQSATGCGATAYAQLLNHWRYPATGRGHVTYTTKTHGIHIDENLTDFTFDYAGMKTAYSGNEDPATVNAIATLMYACGAATRMDYCSYESGAVISPVTSVEHFGFDKSCSMTYRQFLTSDEWESLIRNEIANGRPVIYTGQSNRNTGHIFICDGYDSEGLFHVNWGWEGRYDGYFDLGTLTVENMPEYNFNIDQTVTYNMQPDTGGDASGGPPRLGYNTIEITKNKCDKGDYVSFRVLKITPIVKNSAGCVGCIIYDSDGNEATRFNFSRTYDFEIPGFYDFFWNMTLPAELTDGTYTIVPAFGESTAGMLPMKPALGNSCPQGIILEVSNGGMQISLPPATGRSLELQGGVTYYDKTAYAGYRSLVMTDIKNTGTYFLDKIFLRSLNTGELLHSSNFAINPGETKTFKADILMPAEAGTEQIEAYFNDPDGTTHIIGTFEVTAEAAVAGSPEITICAAATDKTETEYGRPLTLTLDIANSGGMYDGKIGYMIDVDGRGIHSDNVNFRLNGGDSRHIGISIDMKAACDKFGVKEGVCTIYPAYVDMESYSYVASGNPITVTVTPQASGITAAETLQNESPIYTPGGTYAGDDAAKLPKGLYVTQGRKIVVK